MTSSPPTADSAGRARLLLNSLSNGTGTIFVLGVWFCLTPYVVHRLGAAQYGIWVLVSSVVSYSSIADLGLTNGVTKYVAEFRASGDIRRVETVIASALPTLAAAGAVVAVASGGLAYLAPSLFNISDADQRTARLLVVLLGVNAAIRLPAAALVAILRGLHRYDLLNAASVIGTLLSAGVTVAALLAGWGVLGMAAVGIPLELGLQFVMIGLIRRAEPQLRLRVRGGSRDEARRLISFGGAQFLIAVGGTVHNKSDELVIAAFLPVGTITPFALARSISDTPRSVVSQFVTVLMPASSHLAAVGETARLRGLFLTSTRLTLATFALVGGTIVALRVQLLTVWVGATYTSAAHLIPILAGSAFIGIAMAPSMSIMLGMARHRLLGVLSVATAALNLAISLVLVHPLGVTGVALGTLLATAAEAAIALPFALRVIGVHYTSVIRHAIAPALLPALPMTIALVAIPRAMNLSAMEDILLSGAAAVVLYVSAYLAMPGTGEERALLRSLPARVGHRGATDVPRHDDGT